MLRIKYYTSLQFYTLYTVITLLSYSNILFAEAPSEELKSNTSSIDYLFNSSALGNLDDIIKAKTDNQESNDELKYHIENPTDSTAVITSETGDELGTESDRTFPKSFSWEQLRNPEYIDSLTKREHSLGKLKHNPYEATRFNFTPEAHEQYVQESMKKLRYAYPESVLRRKLTKEEKAEYDAAVESGDQTRVNRVLEEFKKPQLVKEPQDIIIIIVLSIILFPGVLWFVAISQTKKDTKQ